MLQKGLVVTVSFITYPNPSQHTNIHVPKEKQNLHSPIFS